MNKLNYIKHAKIDVTKWNACIEQSAQSLPYAYTWYLNCVAQNWDALVLNDYEIVMPLVYLRKLGVACIYQPYYCQQLGLFGNNLSAETASLFIKTATSKFPYIQMNLNPTAAIIASEFEFITKKNLLLPLNKSYTETQQHFTENHKRNINKAIKSGYVFSGKNELDLFQKFYFKNINPAKETVKPKHQKIFTDLSNTLLQKQLATIYSIVDKKGNLCAACLLIKHHNRLIGIINTSSLEGKKNGASHYLFSTIIERFSQSDFTLDFEGSSIAGIARFYEGFGAQPEYFYTYKTHLLSRFIN